MENRLLYRCPVCDIPMLEKVRLRIFLLQHHNGKRLKTEVERDTKSPYSEIRIKCGCGKGAHIFAHINEVIRMQESFSVKKETIAPQADEKSTVATLTQ